MEENEENVISEEKAIANTKTKKGFIIGIVIAVVVVLFLAGYFAFNKGIIGNRKLVGYYEIYEMTSEDQNYSNEELKSLKSLGFKVTLELNEDKKGTLSLFGDTMDLTYDNKNITVDGESTPYTLKDNKLSMEQDGIKLVFEKTEKPENNESTEEVK